MYKSIYVIAPFGNATGGIELAHQLVDYLRTKNQNAFIVYVDNGQIVDKTVDDVMPQYKMYNIEVCSEIEDSPENILVLPEVFFDFILKFDKIKIGAWWMSVDNRYNGCNYKEKIRFQKGILNKLRMFKAYLYAIKDGTANRFKNDNKTLLKNNERVINFYQSKYAQFHIYKLGLSYVLPLSDYINDDFSIKEEQTRENIVLYNPKKGIEFTKKLIKIMPNANFVALQNLSRAELVNYMQKSKIYIDFGHFPGKDRLFREAALNGCCIITGLEGASAYYEDVYIPCDYKIKGIECNLPKIKGLIENIFMNYELHRKSFYALNARTKNEKVVFFKEIDDIFLN